MSAEMTKRIMLHENLILSIANVSSGGLKSLGKALLAARVVSMRLG
jgi:hypothetical protein